MGTARFRFSDRYSVFDWGEMPDLIDGKGAALCLIGAYCFERLEERGVRTHYRGLVDEDGRVLHFDELKQPLPEAAKANILRKYGLSPAQAMLNWVTRNEQVVAIPKASSVGHQEENASSVAVRFSAEEYDKMSSG